MKRNTEYKKYIPHGNNVLARLRKMFPLLEKVVDADESVTVSVIKSDSSSGRKKDPQSCALARACVRSKIADAAVIGIGNSYLIKGNVATRYKTSVAVGREITSFDRHQDFATGKDYQLSKISPAMRLGARSQPGGKWKQPKSSKAETAAVIKHNHRTSRIRVMARD